MSAINVPNAQQDALFPMKWIFHPTRFSANFSMAVRKWMIRWWGHTAFGFVSPAILVLQGVRRALICLR